MPVHNVPFLLASPQPALLAAIEPVLLRAATTVKVVLSGQTALAEMTGPNPPGLLLLDADLPGLPIDDLLACARAAEIGRRFPIVLISDTLEQVWIDRLAAGVIDDLIIGNLITGDMAQRPLSLHSVDASYWQLRVELALRSFHCAREMDALREVAAVSARTDRLTNVLNREALLTALFRETDRVQRLNESMCLVLVDVDDFGPWNLRLGNDLCDELLRQVATRISRLLRSYDLIGRPGMDEFLVALPGCHVANALMLVERVRADVFSVPFHVGGESIRLSACFGMTSSLGRSPVVVLREAEEALRTAKAAGPESIQIFGESLRPAHAPVTYLSPGPGDESMAW
jgi:diguanylate cyclase (GGDEF)-like protein